MTKMNNKDNWKKAILQQNGQLKISDAVKNLSEAGQRIVLVVGDDRSLEGVICDGDIRHALLSGATLNSPIGEALNRSPRTCTDDFSKEELMKIFSEGNVLRIPIVDQSNIVVQLEYIEEHVTKKKRDNAVVLMAGGLGQRLHPLTDELPKPMLKVGDKPILETILRNLIEEGYSKFYFSVNYKSEIVEEHFGDGNQFDVSIEYLREKSRLGTAGALKLMPKQKDPFLVMNGDLLTKINFTGIFDFHSQTDAFATMGVKEYDMQIPYGVVKADGEKIIQIDEKPIQKIYVNAGIYVLKPETLDLIPPDTFFDMTSLFDQLISKNLKSTLFPIHEYWLDIGKMEDFEKAQTDYRAYFY